MVTDSICVWICNDSLSPYLDFCIVDLTPNRSYRIGTNMNYASTVAVPDIQYDVAGLRVRDLRYCKPDMVFPGVHDYCTWRTWQCLLGRLTLSHWLYCGVRYCTYLINRLVRRGCSGYSDGAVTVTSVDPKVAVITNPRLATSD